MNSEILLRFGFAVVIIFFGVGAYWLINQYLLTRARASVNMLPAPLPKKPTIVYFTTPDCAPCKTVQRPALQKLADLLGEKLHVIEIDASEHPDVARTWGVMSVPTTFLLDEKGTAKYVNNGVARLEKLMEQVKTL
ncbi:MAG TPA: thioredoxin family protein [Anaerolineales bacterium]|nr:thioredoxin family protein [Anaerolineales bacterium]